MKVLFEYLYRDAGNNKIWGETYFSNKDDICRDDLLRKIKSKLIDGEFFVAEKVGIHRLHFAKFDHELDHGWHEFFDIRLFDDQLGSSERDIAEFLDAL